MSIRCIISFILIVLLLIFTIVFIIIPFTFKYSTEVQRNIVFPTWYLQPKNYSNLNRYPLKGVRNFYVTVNHKKNITLGLIHILPSDVISEFIKNDDYDYETILKDPKYDVLLYFHGNGQDRLESVGTYRVLRKFFNIISFDYRGYADSTQAELNEYGIVDDTVSLYKIIRNMTKSRIYFWGHSIGTGVALETASVLKKENIIPSGIVLEAPFTSITDVMKENSLVKAYSWLPWFDLTIIDPIISNGFNFDSQTYINDIDCPILIIHCKDDEIIPHEIATKLYRIATSNRNYTYQGNVEYHLLDAVGYGHEWIFEEPSLPNFISKFIDETLKYENLTEKISN